MATGYEEFESKMKKTSELLSVSFASVRAGRANAAVLDQIQVDYYGTPTPIQQIATISTPDPRSLLIQPWDSSTLKPIEKAILASDLGINPQNDGRSIRLVFPQLTEERRKELAKQVKPSARGELEITDVNLEYLRRDQLQVLPLERDVVWLDAGTADSLMDAGQTIRNIQAETGRYVGCLEELAFNQGWLTEEQVHEAGQELGMTLYGQYLQCL